MPPVFYGRPTVFYDFLTRILDFFPFLPHNIGIRPKKKGGKGMPTAINLSENWLDKKKRVTITEKVCKDPIALHMHDYFEIELITGGRGFQNLNGSGYELKRGSMYCLSPIDFHAVIPEGNLPLINISFAQNIISPRLLRLLIAHDKNKVIQLDETALGKFEFLIDLLTDGNGVNDAESETYIKNLLECLIIMIIRHAGISHDAGSANGSFPMQECMRYIFLHFNEAPSMKDISKMSGYSPGHFSKCFHDATGKTYIDFLTGLKLNYAKILLLSTDEPIISVSESCGFSSLSNFNRSFRKATGMSPTEFREQNEGGRR